MAAWPEIPRTQRLATVKFAAHIYADHVYVVSQEWPEGGTRSQLIWQTTISRPTGHTNAEALEAALYRIAAAQSAGSLRFSGDDDAT